MKRVITQEKSTTEVGEQDFIRTGNDDCWLKMFHWCQQDLFRQARVCKHWYSLIMNVENQKLLLFRPVQDTHIYLQRRTGDLRLARNICEAICVDSSIDQEDVDYFKDKNNKIIQEIVTSEQMLQELLNSLTANHKDCKRVVTDACKEGISFVDSDLARLKDHLIDLMNLMFQFLTEENMKKGYGILIPFVLQKLLPFMDEAAEGKIINTLRLVLIGKHPELAIRVIQEEASSFYMLLDSLCMSKFVNVQANAIAAVGLMALNLSNQHQLASWTLFLDKIYACSVKREYFFDIIKNSLKDGFYEKIDLGYSIISLLELGNSFFIECMKANAEKFIFLLEELSFKNLGLMNHATMRALHAIALTENVNLDEQLKERIRLNLHGYFKVEVNLCGNKINNSQILAQEFINLCFKSKFFIDSLIDALKKKINDDYIEIIKRLIAGDEIERNDILKLQTRIAFIVANMLLEASDRRLGFYMPYILEKFLSSFTDDGKISIISVFNLNLHKKPAIKRFEDDFNMYFKVFELLCENSSYKVKTEAVITVALMALNISENYRNRSWALFLRVTSEVKMLQHISTAINNSVDNVTLNFAEKVRKLMLENCTSFMHFFNENQDQMVAFFDYLLLNIENIDIKVDMGLALIAIATNKGCDNQESLRTKVKNMLLVQLKSTNNLLIEIERQISHLKALGDFRGTNFEEDAKTFIEECVQKKL